MAKVLRVVELRVYVIEDKHDERALRKAIAANDMDFLDEYCGDRDAVTVDTKSAEIVDDEEEE
jgi:hypothetical protein